MKPKKISVIACFILALMTLTSFTAGAMMPDMENYMYSYEGKPIPAPPAYTLEMTITGESIGLDAFNGLSDISIASDGTIYALEKNNSRILHIDKNFKLINTITNFNNGDISDSFLNPEGIFISENNTIFIADTGNKRIVILDSEKNLKKIIGQPGDEALIDYTYEPIKVCEDNADRILVLARNQTQGILQFSSEGEFQGYLGATRVIPDAVEMFYRMFATKEQKSRMLRFIPTEYNNMAVDEEGFVYATIGAMSSKDIKSDVKNGTSKSAAVRRLNPGGTDVLNRNGYFPPVGDLQFSVQGENSGASVIIDCAVTKNGIYSLLDQKRGRVFTYDKNGNLLYLFGGCGDESQQMKLPVAIGYQGDRIVVADQARCAILIFKPEQYASIIAQALACHSDGEYDKETLLWQEVLSQNSSYDLAYLSIGKAAFEQKDFISAMEYFKKGHSQIYYSKAFKEQRRIDGAKSFPAVMLAIGIVAVATTVTVLVLKKKGKKFNKNNLFKKKKGIFAELRYSFHVMIHPFDGFWDIKYEQRGSVKAASLLLVLAIGISTLFNSRLQYLFDPQEGNGSGYFTKSVIGIAGLLLLWTVANWCFTTLMDGKGTFKDIYVYTCYSLLPYILFNLALLTVSGMMSLDEAPLFYFMQTAAIAWTAFLIFCGTLVTHEYTIGKTIGSIFLSGVGIGIIVFLGILVVCLVQQVSVFVGDIVKEIIIRA